MFNKNDDTFFNESNTDDNASEDLMQMISKFSPAKVSEITSGSKVHGTVTRIGTEYIYFDIGGKSEAIMSVRECRDNNSNITVQIGDTLSGYVLSDSENEFVVSKKLTNYNAAFEEILQAQKNKIPVQGKVTGVSKDGLSVKIMGKRSFCPISQIDVKFVEDVNVFLGKTLDFVISRVSEGGRNIVLSRIPLLEQDLLSKLENLQNQVENHTVITGTITKIAAFGLFVDIGGIEGLVHISELSWEHTENISDCFTIGQEIEVIILDIQKKSPIKNTKISLSIKQVSENPWNSVEKHFSTGQSVTGKVVRITNFGAFVELLPGVDGLIHVSEMSWIKKVHHPSEIVSIGNEVNVTILAIDSIKKTISLSLKDLSSDPWRDVENKFPVGTETTGIIVKKSRYGFFIDLCEGVTGLLVFSKIAQDKKESLKENETITVTIDSIDTPNRRISLSYGISEAKFSTEDINRSQTTNSSSNNSTEFGAALLAALNRNK